MAATRHLDLPRARRLVAGSVPGILAGFAVRGAIDTDMLKIIVRVAAIGAALILTFRSDDTRTATGTTKSSSASVAGAAGGFLGGTASLNGVPPALLLTRDRLEQLSFVADLNGLLRRVEHPHADTSHGQ